MSTPASRDGWSSRSRAAWATTRPALRIGDAERAGAVDALGEHFATGRLTREEYDERATRALEARTAAEVAPLFADLPGPYPPVLTGRPAESIAATSGSPRSSRRGPTTRAPHRLPVLPMILVLLGVALLLEEAAILLLGLAALWWFAAVRRRRARERWLATWHGARGGGASGSRAGGAGSRA